MALGRPKIDYPAIQSPSIDDIKMSAMFYEGEGSIGNYQDILTVTISQNDRTRLDWLAVRYGGRVYGPYKGSVGNDTYQWKLVRERAYGFALTIYMFLTVDRRNQIKLALSGKQATREYQKSFNSEAFINRKISKISKTKQAFKGSMGLFNK